MAGKEVYVGKIMEKQVASMEALVAKMEILANGIISVANNTAQSIASLKVKPSSLFNVLSPYSVSGKAITVAGYSQAALYTYLTSFKSLASGIVRVSVEYSVSLPAGNDARINISVKDKSSGSVVYVDPDGMMLNRSSSGVYKHTFDLPVESGKVYEFHATGSSSASAVNATYTMNVTPNSFKIGYDLLNIVNEGGIAFV